MQWKWEEYFCFSNTTQLKNNLKGRVEHVLQDTKLLFHFLLVTNSTLRHINTKLQVGAWHLLWEQQQIHFHLLATHQGS